MMTFQGFDKKDFDTFHIGGLEERMKEIQTRIQPKFQEVGSLLTDFLSAELGNELYLHIAKHARRSVNPPNDTWLAIADNKRGYKKHPHFQLGLFDDHLFIWLALIYELPNKKEIAESFIDSFEDIKKLPDSYVVSMDHMKKDSIPLDELELKHMERFKNVKKAEFLIGKQISSEDDLLKDKDAFIESVKSTYEELIPLYRIALRAGR